MRPALWLGPPALLLAFVLYITFHATYLSNRLLHPVRQHPALPATPAGMREVRFSTTDGVSLFAWYLPPPHGATILLMHGLGEGRANLLEEARLLAGAGYGVLLPDMRGHGDSGGERATWGDEEVLDVDAAFAFLRKQPEVDPARIGALGFSMGADALAASAAKDLSISAVVLESPCSTAADDIAADFRAWGALSNWGARLAFRRLGLHPERVGTVNTLPRLAPRRVLVMFGAGEAGIAMADKLEAVAGPGTQFWIVPNAGHGRFLAAAPVEYPSRVLAFFQPTLGSPATVAR